MAYGPRIVDSGSQTVEEAVLSTIAYGDVFEYPLRDVEVHRFLHGIRTAPEVTTAALARCAEPDGPLTQRGSFFMLRGREHLVELRRARAERAARMWPAAIRYGRLIAALPFVRMVAVTGSLTWDTVEEDADIDYLIVTEPDHLWTCRLLVAVLARVARLDGTELCANYLMSTRALALSERTLYGAYELATLTPIAGRSLYRRLLRANPWATAYLPHAFDTPGPHDVASRSQRAAGRSLVGRLARFAERALRSRWGIALERREMRHRIAKRLRVHASGDEAAYGPDWYKAHFRGHRQRVLDTFGERLTGLARRQTAGV
jgi:hypothetical protein